MVVDSLGGFQSCDGGHPPLMAFCPLPQLALEVHDIDGGLRRVKQLLEVTARFDTIIAEQDPQLKGSTLYTVFCTREEPLRT